MGDNCQQKRKRGANFQPVETEVLFDIVKKYFDIVECKKSDKTTAKDKNNAWNLITSEFNSQAPCVPRNQAELKNAWNNKKKLTKKNCAKEKSEIFRTGGGPKEPVPKPDYVEENLREMLGPSVGGLSNDFDSDGTFEVVMVMQENQAVSSETVSSVPPTQELVSEILTEESQDNTNLAEKVSSNDWSSWNITALRMPISPAFKAVSPAEKNEMQNSMPQSKSLLVKKHKFTPSRRRPVLRGDVSAQVHEAKLEYLSTAKQVALNTDKREEMMHKVRLEKEQLESEILKLKLKKLKCEIEE